MQALCQVGFLTDVRLGIFKLKSPTTYRNLLLEVESRLLAFGKFDYKLIEHKQKVEQQALII